VLAEVVGRRAGRRKRPMMERRRRFDIIEHLGEGGKKGI